MSRIEHIKFKLGRFELYSRKGTRSSLLIWIQLWRVRLPRASSPKRLANSVTERPAKNGQF